MIVVLLVLFMVPMAVAEDRAQFQVFPSKANAWYFHDAPKGMNYYFMLTWPGSGSLLTKFGPPAFKLGKIGSVQVAIGPHFNLAAKKTKELVNSVTMDVTPVISAFGLFGAFVNEVGIDRDGKGIWFVRHTVGKDGWGLRWSGCGTFGEKTIFFQIGPTVKFGAIQFWFAWDTINSGWTGEASFSVKL